MRRYQDIARAIQNLSSSTAAPNNPTASERCSCVVTTAMDYLTLLVNLVASAVLSLIVYIVDACTSTAKEPSIKLKAT